MKTAVIFGVAASCVATFACAQSSDESEQRAACMGDALFYCAVYVPNRQQIAQCLVANREQISSACRGVLDAGLSAKAKKRG
jgi:hypothetical protein